MSILIDGTKKVIVQGITGREGMARTKLMKEYGTNVIAGCTPGKGGVEVLEVPVYDTVGECVEVHGGVDASVIFVPAPLVKDAALEAIGAGVPFIVIVPDRVPLHDVLTISHAAKERGAVFLGPNTLGCLSPDKAVLGMMGGRAAAAKKFFKPGPVGVSSRSGGITSSIAYYLGRSGVGATSIVHVGGDPLVGLPHPEIVTRFQDDPDTKAIVIFGEIGTTQEEQVADLMESGRVTKPVVAYIGGKGAKEGTRFSHAGAIIEGGRGTREAKVERLTAAGAHLVEDFDDIPRVTREVLKSIGISVDA
ncbi:MAG: succinate--CoA ligase subunit alpha [Candidatus Eisenbacteria bacterium]|uniref:Succinate--CoA ligase subunit alpha n=1 Tax=Eiseniibacteriota bacterium TaxID=2212470 RepID=A0A948W576_UNCEI|nr:succinate--CoA ligase subunit alpha [Candidatus Eisenbacteria bacterium]MBU1950433.1 succinate--CoA ligase subunit alpha [Candidatus Eisenbacteria bacterium]MBU2690099.1 succinate--CoA ligase subunit alpha [Candidatus Eisenbacteria bacterium]